MMNRLARHAIATVACTLVVGTSLAYAQATRTWVSGVGDDANPCSRTAPCKTFAGAISKTAAGGEISALDPGGFGGVSITKSITINGDGTLAGILGAGANGVIVNAGPNDIVTLRNISINGAGTGLSGIRYLAGGTLIVQNVSIAGFTSVGIDMSLSASGRLFVSNTTIRVNSVGVRLLGTAGSSRASLEHVSIYGAIRGVDAAYGFISVNNSVVAENSGYGVIVYSGASATVDNSMLASNNVAMYVGAGSTMLISNNGVYNNTTAFACGGGVLASAGNNRTGSSGVGCAPTGSIPIQ